MRRLALAATLVALTSLATSGIVAAHAHQICTPGAGDPVIDPEPVHGDDPSGGAILNNPNVTLAAYTTWGMHPIHHFLHIGPSSDTRAITVVRTDVATCP